MNRSLVAAMAASVLVVGAGIVATKQTAPSLPDVQVPAIELSNAQGMDNTAVWLDLFAHASGTNGESLGTILLDPESAALPGQTQVIVIEPENSAQDFERIIDGVVGKMRSPLDAVSSTVNGPDAVTYLILENGKSNGS